MGDQLDLQIVLKAILDAKGFDQAQTALKGFAKQANDAAAPTERTAAAGKKMGQELGGTRGPVADLTRLLLQNIGATTQAGEAAKFLGEATTATAGGVSALALGAGALVVVASFVVPKLMEWARGNEAAGASAKDFNAILDTSVEKIESLIEKVPSAARELQGLLNVLRTEQTKTKTDALKEMGVRLREIEKEAAPLERTLSRYNATQLQGDNLRFYPEARKAKDRLSELRQEQGNLIVKARELEQTVLDGSSATERAASAARVMEEADRAAAKAAEERKRAQEDLNAAILEGIAGQSEARNRENQALLDKDSEDLRKRGAGKLSPELQQKLTEIDIEKKAIQDLADYEAETEELKRKDKLETNALEGEIAAQGLAAASALFGGNKALAIAAAIADTYAGANKALAQFGAFGPAMAAVVIATGLANVQQIRKAQPVGFDDPFNDALANKLGRKSAGDFVHYFGEGFRSGMWGAMGPGGNSTTVNNHYNSGTSVQKMVMPGYLGAGRTEFWKHAKREMERVGGRLDDRTKVGR
jgi:hypothetical protein